MVVADTVVHPVFQAREGDLTQQEGRLGEKFGQAGAGKGGVVAVNRAGGALGHIANDGEVVVQLFGGRQTTRHGSQILQEGVDGAAVGRALQAADQLHHFGQAVFAHGRRDGRPFFEKYEHGFRAASKFAQGARGIKVGIYAVCAQAKNGFGHAGFEDVIHLSKAGVELGAVSEQLFGGDGGHGVCPDPAR